MRKLRSSIVFLFLIMALVSSSALASNEVWSTDVVVVGGGAAGLAAAVEASQLGVEVMVFEKLPMLGGSTILSGGGMSGAGHRFQLAAGLTNDSPELHLEDMLREGTFNNDLQLAKRFTANAGAAIDWLADLGCEFEFQPNYQEHTIQRFVRSHPFPGTGIAIIQTLEAAAKEAGANIYTSSLVTELVTNTSGEVIGVQVLKNDGNTLTVMADRVVLATGGFVGNQEMLYKYAPEIMAMNPKVAGDTRLQGEGILLAQEVGASLQNMEYIKVYPSGSTTDSGRDVYTRFYVPTLLGGILVNREGERFVDENIAFARVYDELVKQTDGRMFVIFDSAIAEEVVKADTPFILGWSNDQVATDLENNTLIRKANTTAELAEIFNLDVDAFVATAAESNITSAPFYGVEIGPNMMFTLGGVRISPEAEALDINGQVIPGLYAAGEVAGAGHGSNYMSGNYVSYAVVFGRIAGKNAANDVLQ
ncbi:MAG: flavocytochrome c [Firmicutes bacterium]|nr:flavocytochrome c [Bacillota bacterium]